MSIYLIWSVGVWVEWRLEWIIIFIFSFQSALLCFHMQAEAVQPTKTDDFSAVCCIGWMCSWNKYLSIHGLSFERYTVARHTTSLYKEEDTVIKRKVMLWLLEILPEFKVYRIVKNSFKSWSRLFDYTASKTNKFWNVCMVHIFIVCQ